MGVDKVKVVQLGAAPTDGGAMNGCDQNLRISMEDLTEGTACFDFLFDCWATFVGRLEDFACAVVFTISGAVAWSIEIRF